MLRRNFACLIGIVALSLCVTDICFGAQSASGVGLAIVDFAYIDTSGEAADEEATHRKQLEVFMAELRHDYESSGGYHLVQIPCQPSCLDDESEPDQLLRSAKDSGARLLMVGGIHKMSTLVQWARVEVIDVDTTRVIADRLFTFRGDNEAAWHRAESFVSREMAGLLQASRTTAPGSAQLRLALFDFELQDFSAGAAATGETPSDTAQLRKATEAVRQLLTQSGHYVMVDVNSADEAAAKAHVLRSCDGCEADIASKLGADQSLLGFVSRISRTEYTVRFQLRDAHTGAILADEDSGLRMGADYSWDRGATRLIKDRLLAVPRLSGG